MQSRSATDLGFLAKLLVLEYYAMHIFLFLFKNLYWHLLAECYNSHFFIILFFWGKACT